MMNRTSNASDKFDVGGIDFVLRNADLYIPYLVLYSFGAVIGSFGNLLIMITIILDKELHNSTYILIFNLSLADISISALVDSSTVIAALLGKNEFTRVYLLCDFIAAICLVSCATSMVMIGFLAFNRYLLICHNHLYPKVFTTRNTFLFCLLGWTIGILVDVPNITGWGGHTYSNDSLSCIWDRKANHGYTVFFPMTTVVIPCCCILFFYIKIYLVVRDSKKKTSCRKSIAQISIAKGLFASFSLFTLSWLPYGLVVMTDWKHDYPVAAELYTVVVAHLNSAMNPILYGIFNPGFKRGYMDVFNRILRRASIKHKFKTSIYIESQHKNAVF